MTNFKIKCKNCKNIFIEKIGKNEKLIKYPHSLMVDYDGRLDVIYCDKCKSEECNKI